MLVCWSAARLPSVMVAMLSAASSWGSGMLVTVAAGPSGRRAPKAKKRSSMAKPAALEPTDRNAVTGIGAPV